MEPRDIALVVRIPGPPTEEGDRDRDRDRNLSSSSSSSSRSKSESESEGTNDVQDGTLRSDDGPEFKATGIESEELEEMFEEVGMEFLDELVPLEEDDERRKPPFCLFFLPSPLSLPLRLFSPSISSQIRNQVKSRFCNRN